MYFILIFICIHFQVINWLLLLRSCTMIAYSAVPGSPTSFQMFLSQPWVFLHDLFLARRHIFYPVHQTISIFFCDPPFSPYGHCLWPPNRLIIFQSNHEYFTFFITIFIAAFTVYRNKKNIPYERKSYDYWNINPWLRLLKSHDFINQYMII